MVNMAGRFRAFFIFLLILKIVGSHTEDDQNVPTHGKHINPQNARHPELQRSWEGKQTRRKVPLLPNMFSLSSPILQYVPFPPYPLPLPAFNAQMIEEDLLETNPRLRSGGPGLLGNGHFQWPVLYHPRIRPDVRYGPTRRREEKDKKLQDEEEIVAGKFRPCGGECASEEFLCVGSCTCIPMAFRCDGKPDCNGYQDELECGEAYSDAELVCLQEQGNIRCPRSGKCIKNVWLCDGDDDCGDFSDETHCDGQNCTESQFECNNGMCIDKNWACDGENDCKDNSDEINCTKLSVCSDSEFRCEDGSCISSAWKCDFEQDCNDGSDETQQLCPQEPRACTESEFECTYPRCIRRELQCDGDDDCGDGSDELNCPHLDITCSPSEFQCKSGKCISLKWYCDDETDCEDGGDESNCKPEKHEDCSDDKFPCRTGKCILKNWVCDGIPDCIHSDDEEGCVQRCHIGQFSCAAHVKYPRNETAVQHRSLLNCIHTKHVCDGKKDCIDGQDEEDCPTKRPCEKGSPCKQLCITRKDGSKGCACKPGYTLSEDGFSCQDVDECLFENEPLCSQTCTNTIGSFVCSCMKGYVLRPDKRTCKALGDQPTLLFANRVDIRQISLNNVKYFPIVRGLHNVISIDFHYTEGWIYWSDVALDIIKRSKINGTDKSVIVKWGLESPGGLAVDWIHSLLFWTDSGTRRVEVVTIDGKHRYVVASHDLAKPRAISVHPGNAFVFWTDWGSLPKIERANMDGSNRISIVTENIFWPNGLTIDYSMDRIYWADAKHHVIESAQYDGSDRKKVITKGLPHPFALTLFEDALFWTDWHTKSIATANKETGVGYKVLHSDLHYPMDIHCYHPQRQPNFTNHCGTNYGGCSHMCLPTPKSYRCVCPLGYELQSDKKSCLRAEKLLVFSREKDIRLRQPIGSPESENLDHVIPIDAIQTAVGLAIDSTSERIYWTDVEADTISRSHLNGSQQQALVTTNLDSPTGLAIDWLTQKLYWTDTGRGKIEVANLNGSNRAVVIWDDLTDPIDIALHPTRGWMYWTEGGETPKIGRAGMDGSSRSVLIAGNLVQPGGIAVDYETHLFYWADGGTHEIWYSNLDGTGSTRLNIKGTEIEEPFGLAVIGKMIFWTDWKTKNIHAADKLTGDNGHVVRKNVSGLMDIEVYEKVPKKIKSPCLDENGGCSHLCLLSPNKKGYSCACPIGVKLLNEKRCASGPINSLIVAHRTDIRQISLDVPYIEDIVLPLPPMKRTVAVDVDQKTGDIYWSDTLQDVIQRASRDGSVCEDIIIDSLDEAGGIVVDSTGRKIYWTDDGRDTIEVAELDGTNRKVLIYSDLDKPRAITLHYHLGLMFWSDWGAKPQIECADMDGSHRKALITKDLGWPNGLAIDRPAGRLYWNDGQRQTIESADLKGNNRKVILQNVPHPYGLVIVGMHMYWTDWKTEAVHRADKLNGNDSQVIRTNLTGLMDIRSIQVENIAENACGTNNGGCSHLCLRTPNGFNCACPTGILLQPDRKSCNPTPSNWLMVATRSMLVRISLDTPDVSDVALPVAGMTSAVALDFHYAKQLIFFTDVYQHIIGSTSMINLTDTKILVKNLTAPDGLAIDWLADNMYWAETNKKRIEVSRLDGTYRKLIIDQNLNEPRALALFPRKGLMFWTDWGGEARIERALLDGTSRKIIVTSDIGFPNGLVVDYVAKKLYWADSLKDRIETCDLNGKARTTLIAKAEHPFGLCQFGEYIYWTDWYQKSIQRADKTTGRDQVTLRKSLDGAMEIHAVSASRQTGSSPCQVNNGGCPQLCLFREKDYLCACQSAPSNCKEEIKIVEEKTNKQQKEQPGVTLGAEDKILDPDGVRSPLDSFHGDPSFEAVPSSDVDKQTSQQQDTYSFLVLVPVILGTLAMIGVVIAIIIMLRRGRKETFYNGSQNVLAFSNPNYTSSVENSDKRSFLWKKLKYDRSQDRVFGVQEERPEGVGLMADSSKASSPPSSPPRKIIV